MSKEVIEELVEVLRRVENKIRVLAYVKLALIYGLMSIFMVGCIVISTILGLLNASAKVLIISLVIFYVAFTTPAFKYVSRMIKSVALSLGTEYKSESRRSRVLAQIPWIIAFVVWYIIAYKLGYISFAPAFLIFLAIGNIGSYIYNLKTYNFKANYILVSSLAMLALGSLLLFLCVETRFINTPAKEGLFIELSFTTGVLVYIIISMYSLHKALHAS